MKNFYKIEFYYQEEVMDWKESNLPLIIPHIGETITILSYENPANSEGHNSWIVTNVRHNIWTNPEKTLLTQLIMLDVEPIT